MAVTLPVVDSSHDCKSCRAQSDKFYEVGGRCLSCGQRYRVKVRNGDKPPLSVECPRCEVTEYSWRTHEEYARADTGELARPKTLRDALVAWKLQDQPDKPRAVVEKWADWYIAQAEADTGELARLRAFHPARSRKPSASNLLWLWPMIGSRS